MKGSIIFQNRIGGEITFKVTNEHLWERIYHELAFLAESGRGVSYTKGGGERYKLVAYGSGKSCLTWAENKDNLEAKKHSLELDGYTSFTIEKRRKNE